MRNKIGILGDGQLARMLCLKGHEMGLDMYILSKFIDSPAAQVCRSSRIIKGGPKDLSCVESLINAVDFVTFESEFVSDNVLPLLKKSKKVYPRAKTMEMVQDRLTQKNILEKYSLPTSPFIALGSTWPASLKWEGGIVLKARRDGYDGKGTWIYKTQKDYNNNIEKDFENKKPKDFIIEELIYFKRELALTFACSDRDQIEVLPLVETKQVDHRCLWAKGPVNHPQKNSLIKKIKSFLRQLNYRGVITFELFDTGDELLVNEVAPRVHNSAHYSMDALVDDQFKLHLQCLLGSKLNRPEVLADGFAMFNLIGSHRKKTTLIREGDFSLHWYGKKENYKGRKMGHLNTLSKSPELALRKLKKIRQEFNV